MKFRFLTLVIVLRALFALCISTANAETQIKVNESTGANRRIPFVLVDETDGETPETGITLTTGDIKISKNGATPANHSGTVSEVDASAMPGIYYYEAAVGEVDTLGSLVVYISKSGVRSYSALATVTNKEMALEDSAITSSKYSAGAITSTAVADNFITSNKVADDFINASKVAADTIGASEIAANAIGASEVADGAIDAGAVAAAALDADAITSALGNRIADQVARRNTANIEGSSYGDTLNSKSLYGAAAKLTHRLRALAGELANYKSDDVTELVRQDLSSDASAAPITEIGSAP